MVTVTVPWPPCCWRSRQGARACRAAGIEEAVTRRYARCRQADVAVEAILRITEMLLAPGSCTIVTLLGELEREKLAWLQAD